MSKYQVLRKACIVQRQIARGFTMVETLVVLVLIGLLISIATPIYYNRVEQSRELVLAQNLHALRNAIDHFYADTGRYPTQLAELVERRYLRDIPTDPYTQSNATWIVLNPEAAQKALNESARQAAARALERQAQGDRLAFDDRRDADRPPAFDRNSLDSANTATRQANAIADVRSGAEGNTANGVPYGEL
jgi:general secretion pathway protein G